jgi:molybdopterin molybdotransferase
MSLPTRLDDIAARLQGYDPQALSADTVAAFLAELVAPLTDTQWVATGDSLNRVLAGPLVSPISVPPHDNSAMDGYAFASADLHPHQTTVLRLVDGVAFAGAAWAGHCPPGSCVRIMTGAIMPTGLDTVIPQELVQAPPPQPPTHIHIPAGVVCAGDNRRLCGEDLMAGQPALHGGQRIQPAAMGLIASLGVARVQVVRRLKVAYFSTGNEILTLGEPLREGAVYDSNRYTVRGMLERLGIEMLDMGVIRDEPGALQTAFTSAAAQADVVLTSGGVSVGDADHTKTMMKQLGDVAFWRIAMRPGRPMAVGRIARSPGQTPAVVFGLPGNPVAVMVTFLAFVRPALLRMMGARAETPPLLVARSADALRKKPGRTEYQRATVTPDPTTGQLWARITGNQGSGVLSSMVQANGLLVLPHHQGAVAAGDPVQVMMFDGVI